MVTQAGAGNCSEASYVYRALNQLAQAGTAPEQLQAVSDYARDNGAAAGMLLYTDAGGTAREVAAQWSAENGGGMMTDSRLMLVVTRLLRRVPPALNEPLLVRDVLLDERLEADCRALCAGVGVRALALLPLHNPREGFGALLFCWYKPAHFHERDARVYKALQQQAAVVVDCARLYEQNSRLRAHALATGEMNDSILQALYGIWLGARTARTLFDRDASRLAEPLDYIVTLAKNSLIKSRALGLELHADSASSPG